MTLPRFAIDGQHRAALVAGRAREAEQIDRATIERCVEAVEAFAARTGLPLAFVAGDYPDDCTDTMAAAGIVIAHALEGQATMVEKGALSAAVAIPDELWDVLAEAGVTFPEGAQDDPDFPGEGLFLVPAGWSTAQLRLGDEKLLSASSESTVIAKPVSEAIRARVADSDAPLALSAGYA